MIEQVIGYDTDNPVILATRGSVGAGGNNYFEDIKLVQSLLNNVSPDDGGPLARLAVDGSPGPKTIAAIKRFQSENLGFADGRVDARGETIETLVAMQLASGQPLPRFAGLRFATSAEAAPSVTAFNFPDRPTLLTPPQPTLTSAVGASVRGSSGFGAPFTKSGWTIDNSVNSFDASIKDTGVYFASMTIFRDDNPSDRFKLTLRGAFKSVSAGPPIGADFALENFPSTKGVIFRGLTGMGPISPINFIGGLCGFAFAGGNPIVGGATINFFQFNWAPAPPGACLGFAFMAGLQYGVPGIAAGAGTAIQL